MALDALKAILETTSPATSLVVTGGSAPATVLASELDTALGVVYQPPITIAYTAVVNTSALNFRASPSLKAHIINELSFGTIVDVIAPATPILSEGVKWLNIRVGGGAIVGYAAEQYLFRVKPPPPPSTANKIGLHLMGTLSAAELDFAAKHTATVIKSVENPAALIAVNQAQPLIYAIYRKYYPGSHWSDMAKSIGVGQAVASYMAEMSPLFSQMPWAYFESDNEATPDMPYLQFEAARARAMATEGFHACVLNIGTGISSSEVWGRSIDLLKAVEEGDHLIGVHDYAQTIMSADYGANYFDSSGNWVGEFFPAALPLTPDIPAWTGLRVLRDLAIVTSMGFNKARFVETECGVDAVSTPGNGIHAPNPITSGWKTCADAWAKLGRSDAAQFYRDQLDWHGTIIGLYSRIVGSVVFTYGTDDPEWDNYDIRGVLADPVKKKFSVAVPYRSQEDPDARRYRNDCGPACVAMLIDWQRQSLGLPVQPIPIDTLSAQTTLATRDDGLATWVLVPLAAKYGLRLKLVSDLSIDSITAELSAGRPVLALISYAPLLGRENQGDHFGHFVIVTGIDADNAYLNDPDFWNQGTHNREDGHNWQIPISQFEAAIVQSPVPRQGLLVA